MAHRQSRVRNFGVARTGEILTATLNRNAANQAYFLVGVARKGIGETQMNSVQVTNTGNFRRDPAILVRIPELHGEGFHAIPAGETSRFVSLYAPIKSVEVTSADDRPARFTWAPCDPHAPWPAA